MCATAYLSLAATEADAQAGEPAITSTPAGTVEAPPASEPPPPAAVVEVPPPAPTLAPIEPSFPTPVTTEPAPPAVPAAEPPPADPLSGGIKFKAGKGVDIKSADGNWAMNLRLKGQFLDELQLPTLEGAPSRNYPFIRRMRLAFAGSVFTKDIKYKVELTFAGNELSRQPVGVSGATPSTPMGMVTSSSVVVQQAPLLDLYLDFVSIRDLSLRVGQAKVTYGRERVLSDSDLHTVDRSIDDAEFNLDRDIGIELRSLDLGGIDRLRYYLGIYAAEDRNAGLSSSGVGSPGTGDFGLLYLARFEVLPMGSFEETPVDFARTTPKLSFAVAYTFIQTDLISPYVTQTFGSPQAAMGRPSEVDFNIHNFTADFLFKASGFSALGAFHYRKLADLPTGLNGRDGLGFVLQAHYLLSKETPLGITANVSMVRNVGDDSTIEERTEAGGGLGYYFHEHALKLEAEFEHIWREADDARAPDNRLRFQLSFII